MPLPAGYVFPDLSNYVRVTDWAGFANAYPVAACKVTEGATFADPFWPTFQSECRRRGVLPIGYHFLRRSSNLNEQVANYLRRLDGPVGIALDVETAGDGSNPTMEQADAWLDAVSARTGVPRARMLTYVPRWWWTAHGGGSAALADTLWWQSQYAATPDLSSMAGWVRPTVLQFSSTSPGAGMPNGDMNVAIGRTAAQLAQLLMGSGGTGMAMDADVTAAFAAVNKKIDDIGQYLMYGRDDPPAHVGALDLYRVVRKVEDSLDALGAGNPDGSAMDIAARLTAIEARLDGLTLRAAPAS